MGCTKLCLKLAGLYVLLVNEDTVMVPSEGLLHNNEHCWESHLVPQEDAGLSYTKTGHKTSGEWL